MIHLVDQIKKLTNGDEVYALYTDTSAFYPGAVLGTRTKNPRVYVDFVPDKAESTETSTKHWISSDRVIPKLIVDQTISYCGICEKPLKCSCKYIHAKCMKCCGVYSLHEQCLKHYLAVVKVTYSYKEVIVNY